jgi:hypothetical protein
MADGYEDIPQTEYLGPDNIGDDGNNGNGSKPDLMHTQKKPPMISGGQLMGQMGQKDLPNALNYLVNPGDSLKGMAMRTIIPSKRNEGHRQADIRAFHIGRLMYFGHRAGIEILLIKDAYYTSVDGLAREQLTRAITGEQSHQERMAGGLLQRWGYGDKK